SAYVYSELHCGQCGKLLMDTALRYIDGYRGGANCSARGHSCLHDVPYCSRVITAAGCRGAAQGTLIPVRFILRRRRRMQQQAIALDIDSSLRIGTERELQFLDEARLEMILVSVRGAKTFKDRIPRNFFAVLHHRKPVRQPEIDIQAQ